MVNLGCEVDYTFKNGFILGVEHLHTITSKIKERYPDEALIYKITKSDSYVYSSADVDDIINEENGSSNYIKKLEVILNSSETINFNLCFEKKQNTTLRIKGSDKDKIYLLYNDIKTYVEKEITTVRFFIDYESVSTLIGIVMIPLLFVAGCLAFSSFNEDKYRDAAINALNSNDLGIKLNYLIEEKIRSSTFSGREGPLVRIIMWIAVLTMLGTMLYSFLMRKESVIRITDYFLFGKQIKIYDKKLKLRNQIIWTVVVGLIISMIAGFIVYYVTK